MDVLCIFNLFKEISDNPAESHIPEDAEEFSSRTLHLALQPTDSAPKFVLESS